MTRKDGGKVIVKVIVKERDPEVFEILNRFGAILKKQMKEQEKLFSHI